MNRLRRQGLYAAIFCLPIALLAPWLGSTWDNDEGTYAVIAIGMRHGLVPYRDLFDHKPPLIYGIYWIAFLPGVHLATPRLLEGVVLGATGLMIVVVARQLGYRPMFAVVAGLA